MGYTPHLGIDYALLWWLMLEGIGLIALPLTFRLFRHLPDRGYAFARPMGLIVINYLLWMLSTLGFLHNTWGNILFVLILTLIASVLFYRHGQRHSASGDIGLVAWLRAHWRTAVVTEILFTAAFALWIAYKAYDPNIASTEKPMEYAFLNAIVRSERFPAHDPWMSGYGISYYHFGYIMVATMCKFTCIPTSYAFNLGIVTLFALTASGAFSVVYNLVHNVAARRSAHNAVHRAIIYGLIAVVTILLMGNLEGALEFLHANGVGVTVNEPGSVTGPFWEWIDVHDLTQYGTISKTWHPTDVWWWWRASRVIHDKGLTGKHMEVISEFPAFSFLLGDMHPHVLAYPFVFLVLGLAFNLLLSTASPTVEEWWLVYLCLGALGFLNTWDLPIYFFILVASYGLNRYLHPSLQSSSSIERALSRLGISGASWAGQVFYRALELGIASVLLYLPYWLYGRPKAGSGILPNLFNVTRFVQFLLMFGPFVVVLAVLLFVLFVDLWRKGQVTGRSLLRQGALIWTTTILAFPVLLVTVLIPVVVSPQIRTYIDAMLESTEIQQFLGAQTLDSLLRVSLRIRIGLLPPQLKTIHMPSGPWTFIFLSLSIAAMLFWFVRSTFPRWLKSHADEINPPSASLHMAMLMAFTALMLISSVEFVYLHDVFGSRMNTVFKFYFQAWALLSMVTVFGLYYVLEGRGTVRAGRLILGGIFALLVVAGLLYSLGMSISRTGGFAGPATLDGMAFVARQRPEEYAAIQWLNENVPGSSAVIVEAVQGSFAYEHARVSGRTGLPAVMGWTGHENQWHALYDEIRERERDTRLLYEGSVQDAMQVMQKYNVTYVFVGYLERAEFEEKIDKFERFMDVAFRIGDTVVYKRRR